MRDQGAPTGPRGMARTALAVGIIAAAVVVLGCEKKSDADAGAKAPEPAASEAKPAETAAAPQPAPAAEAKPADAAAAPQPAPAAPTQTAMGEAPDAEAIKSRQQPTEHMAPFDSAKPYTRYPDGTWDFRTYRGYNMYHSICHVCHGANANGSSFAPALKESLKTLTYEDFVATVMNGRENITSSTTNVMPSFGENPTVTKYIDSLYAYLKARSTGDLGTAEVQWEGPKLDPVQ